MFLPQQEASQVLRDALLDSQHSGVIAARSAAQPSQSDVHMRSGDILNEPIASLGSTNRSIAREFQRSLPEPMNMYSSQPLPALREESSQETAMNLLQAPSIQEENARDSPVSSQRASIPTSERAQSKDNDAPNLHNVDSEERYETAQPHLDRRDSEQRNETAQDLIESCVDKACREAASVDETCSVDLEDLDHDDDYQQEPISKTGAHQLHSTKQLWNVDKVKERLRREILAKAGCAREAFKAFDVNGSETISKHEWLMGVNNLKLNVDTAVMPDKHTLFTILDENRDGHVDMFELLGVTKETEDVRAMETMTLWRKHVSKKKHAKVKLERPSRWTQNAEDAGNSQLQRLQLEHEKAKHRTNIKRDWGENRPGALDLGWTKQILGDPRLHRKCGSNATRELTEEDIMHSHGELQTRVNSIKKAMHDCSESRREIVHMQALLRTPRQSEEDRVARAFAHTVLTRKRPAKEYTDV